MKIAVKDLHPNPFRDLKQFPINNNKVKILEQSIDKTGFWDNVLVRKASNGSSGYEIAYGHHRLRALKNTDIKEVNLPVRDISDADMIRIMAHENMEEWSFSATAQQETIRTVVKAYADGIIELSPPGKSATQKGLHYAPSFQPGVYVPSTSTARPYTVETIAEFLGKAWPATKVGAILSGLTVIEQGLLDEEDMTGLTTYQVKAVVGEVRRAERETGDPKLAKSVGHRLAAGMHHSTDGTPGLGRKPKDGRALVSVHNAPYHTNEMIRGHVRKNKPRKMPPLEKFVEQLSTYLLDIPTVRTKEKLDAVIQYKTELRAQDRRLLIGALQGVIKRTQKYVDRLED